MIYSQHLGKIVEEELIFSSFSYHEEISYGKINNLVNLSGALEPSASSSELSYRAIYAL